MSKAIFKKWWFWLIVVFIALGIIFSPSEEERQAEQAKQEQAKQEKEQEREEKKKKKEEEQREKEQAEENASPEEKLEKTITDIIEKESGTKINKIEIVENFADDSEGGYNALIHVVFDRQNRPKTAKGAINAITDKIGSKLAGTEGLENATFFWEVPYILEGDNIIKIGAKQEDGKMYRVEEWFNGHYFE